MNDIVKSLLFSFFLFVIFSLLIFFLFFTPYLKNFVGSLMGNQWVGKNLDLEKFNQNPEIYFGKNVVVIGEASLSSEVYVNCNKSANILTDKRGYQIKVCPSSEKLQKGKTYTLKGTIVKDTSKSTNKEDYIFKVD